MGDAVRPWEPEPLTRLRRERAGIARKRDELKADYEAYDAHVKKLDDRIREWERKMSGEASGDG